MKPTFGQKATEALFALFEKAKLSGKPGAMARENIAPDMIDLLDEMAARYRLEKKAPKTPAQRTAEMEDIWLAELEADPAMAGIDVRKALAEAQFWCRNNARVCTRKFFSNWLLNPKHRPILNGGGHSVAHRRGDPYSEPADWRERIVELPYDRDRLRELASGKWLDVPLTLRQELVR